MREWIQRHIYHPYLVLRPSRSASESIIHWIDTVLQLKLSTVLYLGTLCLCVCLCELWIVLWISVRKFSFNVSNLLAFWCLRKFPVVSTVFPKAED